MMGPKKTAETIKLETECADLRSRATVALNDACQGKVQELVADALVAEWNAKVDEYKAQSGFKMLTVAQYKKAYPGLVK